MIQSALIRLNLAFPADSSIIKRKIFWEVSNCFQVLVINFTLLPFNKNIFWIFIDQISCRQAAFISFFIEQFELIQVGIFKWITEPCQGIIIPENSVILV